VTGAPEATLGTSDSANAGGQPAHTTPGPGPGKEGGAAAKAGPGLAPDADFDERVAALDPALRKRVEHWLERHPRRVVRTRAHHEFDPGKTVNLEGVEEAMEQQHVPASYEGVIREYFRRDPPPKAEAQPRK